MCVRGRSPKTVFEMCLLWWDLAGMTPALITEVQSANELRNAAPVRNHTDWRLTTGDWRLTTGD